MKINRTLLSMALGGAALPLGLAAASDSVPPPKPLSSVGRIGDSYPAVGNSTIVSQRPVSIIDHRPEAFRQNVVSTNQAQSSGEYYANSARPNMHSASYAEHDSGYDGSNALDNSGHEMDGGSSSSCSSSACDSGSCDGIGGFRRSGNGRPSLLGNGCSPLFGNSCSPRSGWGSVEALLWWGPNVQSPPLVVEGPNGQQPNSIIAGGSDTPLGGSMQTGLRVNIGTWLDDCQTVGIGGRAFGMFDDRTTQTYSSNGAGDVTLGVPYFDVLLGGPNFYPVALDTLTSGADSGSITIDNGTRFLAAEGYGRFLLARSGASRADLIGGYTFARLDDTLGLRTRSVDGINGNATVNGTVSETFDRFSSKNTFHGGHIGFMTDISRGRWTFSTLGKVALGNMNQRASNSGSFVDTVPPPGGTASGNRGLLVQDSNTGNGNRNVFTFIPEAGAKLSCCLGPRMKFGVGYTFLFFPDVVMAGNLIDPNIDFSNAFAPTAPQPRFGHDTYYLHGVDLGLTYQF
ncbi:MAG: BBP7 family outer membrane beta-barrel protein [Pirellulaceae bacterium]|nr:BBP7 family outer membrane beta-barrel protein [Pirellulaceae bacterium]